ncbi:HAD family hydrolase [Vibrio breoganii]
MLSIRNYDVFIFDCDGVILDSNELKIEAMKNALLKYIPSPKTIELCLDYFRNNFGKSRFHHVAYFLDEIVFAESESRGRLEKLILSDFSKQCRNLYHSAEITPGFLEFLQNCQGKRYIASGSEQNELREVFIKRGLSNSFHGIYGSPVSKVENIKDILQMENTHNAVVFGDAISDLFAAKINKCHFVAYVPYSNVPVQLEKETLRSGYDLIHAWSDIKC